MKAICDTFKEYYTAVILSMFLNRKDIQRRNGFYYTILILLAMKGRIVMASDARQWKCGVSTGAFGELNEEIFKKYSDSGIDCMEISLNKEKYDALDWKSTYSLSKRYGVGLWSFHLPFWKFDDFDISGAVTECDVKKAIELHKEYIKRFTDIGIKIGVIHPSGEPIEDGRRYGCIERAKESLAELAECAACCGAEIAVEDLPRTCLGNCSDEIKEIISADKRLRVCFDTNHLLKEDNFHFIENVGDKIVTIHVSDYDFVDEKHWLPYEGKNDWVGIVTALENIGYSGPFMYELSVNPPKQIERRVLTLDDFYDNYTACINKVPAKIIEL